MENRETKKPEDKKEAAAVNQSAEIEDNPKAKETDNGDKKAQKERDKKPAYKRPAFLIIAAIVILIGGIFGVRYWLHARSHESTDDAFIDGHIVQVSPKVSGYISKVYVKSNQEVKEGDLIAEIDAKDYETRLEQAKASLDAGMARLKEAETNTQLTKANTSANVEQSSATVQQAQSNVNTQRAAAAAERSRTAQATAAIRTAEANLAQARSQVPAAEAEAVRANADVERYEELYKKDEISQQRLDQAIAVARTANAQLNAAREKVIAAESQVNEARAAQNAQAENARRAETQITGAQAQVNEAKGRLAQANTAPQQVAVSEAQAQTAGASIEQLRAAVKQAELELSYTKIYAPETGRVAKKSVEEGALVQIGQPLMAVVSKDVWITANFKENQVGDIKPGQKVEIYIDAYPGRTFTGHVDSIQAGTGAQFSLLPPENAAGNYVKVVQRVPVKIVFDNPPDPNQILLAPGMSVEPDVRVK